MIKCLTPIGWMCLSWINVFVINWWLRLYNNVFNKCKSHVLVGVYCAYLRTTIANFGKSCQSLWLSWEYNYEELILGLTTHPTLLQSRISVHSSILFLSMNFSCWLIFWHYLNTSALIWPTIAHLMIVWFHYTWIVKHAHRDY